MKRFCRIGCGVFLLLLSLETGAQVRVGAKNFTEGYLTGEYVAQKLEQMNAKVQRRFGLGGTGIVYEALKNGQIDLYVEYTGTIQEAILKRPGPLSFTELSAAVENQGFALSPPLGFNNTYALAVRREFAEKNHLKTMSDLAALAPAVRFGFTHEFFSREDGFFALKRFYQYDPPRDHVNLMEHALLYPAIAAGKVDVIEVYSTDGRLKALDLVVLTDDRGFFPTYSAVILASREFTARHPRLWRDLSAAVAGSLSEQTVRGWNAAVDLEKRTPHDVIAAHFKTGPKIGPKAEENPVWPRILNRTREHFFLVGVTMLLCVSIGLPLGLLALRARWLGQVILLSSSLIQTIPSLALLCFLIPVFGIGQKPALVALFLYGLLPIVVNTYTGVSHIGRAHLETAKALGMSGAQRLFWIELPMASPYILNGIKTSTVLTIGTATLAALIGAGGYGAPIITGLAMNSTPTILIGAIPAAAMALLAHLLFQIVGVYLLPQGLKK